ncbi:hypothetical protein BD769DRAFT_1645150 [Suillus cothurnatus]|nr:hypothetical protein BD769DRAFT_1645150 [Suillus cothurnatus]
MISGLFVLDPLTVRGRPVEDSSVIRNATKICRKVDINWTVAGPKLELGFSKTIAPSPSNILDIMKIQFAYYLPILAAAAGANAVLASTCIYDCLDPDGTAVCGAGWGPVWNPSLKCDICCTTSLE